MARAATVSVIEGSNFGRNLGQGFISAVGNFAGSKLGAGLYTAFDGFSSAGGANPRPESIAQTAGGTTGGAGGAEQARALTQAATAQPQSSQEQTEGEEFKDDIVVRATPPSPLLPLDNYDHLRTATLFGGPGSNSRSDIDPVYFGAGKPRGGDPGKSTLRVAGIEVTAKTPEERIDILEGMQADNLRGLAAYKDATIHDKALVNQVNADIQKQILDLLQNEAGEQSVISIAESIEPESINYSPDNSPLYNSPVLDKVKSASSNSLVSDWRDKQGRSVPAFTPGAYQYRLGTNEIISGGQSAKSITLEQDSYNSMQADRLRVQNDIVFGRGPLGSGDALALNALNNGVSLQRVEGLRNAGTIIDSIGIGRTFSPAKAIYRPQRPEIYLVVSARPGAVGRVPLPSAAESVVARSAFTERYLAESGGRWGNTATRTQNYGISTELQGQGFRVTGGGGIGPEEFIKGVGPGTKGGTFVDITAKGADGRFVRIQTIDTLPNGLPTPNEAAAAARIRAAFPNDELRLIPKVR
ncbi:MAG: hypothetical protein HC850_09425 [Rhodomicrobium sp.]|nr:hypothetical protein [Rhodomicrobium sp.]